MLDLLARAQLTDRADLADPSILDHHSHLRLEAPANQRLLRREDLSCLRRCRHVAVSFWRCRHNSCTRSLPRQGFALLSGIMRLRQQYIACAPARSPASLNTTSG